MPNENEAAVIGEGVVNGDRVAAPVSALVGVPAGMVEATPRGGVVVELPIAELRIGHTVRVGDDNDDYINVLTETGGAWPPILVRRSDRAVIDGRYRCLAAARLGWERIPCELFDGDDAAAHVESVRRNVGHGMPLTLAERKLAAERILEDHPEWSDRRIAALCALAKGTVGRLRPTVSMHVDGDGDRPATMFAARSRQGRDGKWRPVDPREARRDIEAAIRENPEASLREIARVSGSTVMTVRSVKQALTEKARAKDFDLWFTGTGDTDPWRDYVDAVPVRRIDQVLEDARRRAADWKAFAEALSRRVDGGRPEFGLLRAASE